MQDPLITNYVDRAVDVLLTAGGVSIEAFLLRPITATLARMRAIMRFHDGSSLALRMRVDISEGFPSVRDYSFHYMTADDTTIFRYDDSDYHPGGENDPHHKHEGADERVIDCPQPSVAQIRDEIAEYLREQEERQTTK